MEEKHTALVALGVIVILGILGLVLMFSTAKTGAAYVSHYEYAGFPTEQRGAFPYYRATYSDVIDTPGYQQRMPSPYQQDWAWRREPTNTYGAKMGRCSILATPEIGEVPKGYTWDATYQQAMSKGMENCIRAVNSQSGWCCKQTTSY